MLKRIGPGGPFLVSPLAGDGSFVAFDEGENWWSGTQFNFASIATAGAALALSASIAIAAAGNLNQNDELAPLAGISASSSAINKRAVQAPIQQIWGFEEELPSQFKPEENEWQAPQLVAAKVVVPTWVEDDLPIAAAAPSSIVEHDEWTPPSLRLAGPTVFSFNDTDERWQPAAASFALDEDLWAGPPVALAAANGIVWATDDEVAPTASSSGGSASGAVNKRMAYDTQFNIWPFDDELPGVASPASPTGKFQNPMLVTVGMMMNR